MYPARGAYTFQGPGGRNRSRGVDANAASSSLPGGIPALAVIIRAKKVRCSCTRSIFAVVIIAAWVVAQIGAS